MREKELRLDELIASNVDFLNIIISKKEVIHKDPTEPMKLLTQLTSNRSYIKYFRERVNISFEGYNETNKELWEIPDVRNYVAELDSQFPYWLYFLSKEGYGLLVIIKCFLLPFLNPEAEKEINAQRLQRYLEKRGFLAMNQLCELTNIPEEENIQMTNRLVKYLSKK